MPQGAPAALWGVSCPHAQCVGPCLSSGQDIPAACAPAVAEHLSFCLRFGAPTVPGRLLSFLVPTFLCKVERSHICQEPKGHQSLFRSCLELVFSTRAGISLVASGAFGFGC